MSIYSLRRCNHEERTISVELLFLPDASIYIYPLFPPNHIDKGSIEVGRASDMMSKYE